MREDKFVAIEHAKLAARGSTVRVAAVVLVSLCFQSAFSQVSSKTGRITVVQYTVTVDQPAYVGEPIWIHTTPQGKIHYPFRTGIGDLGCNRLELMHDGKLVPPRQVQIWGDASGILCGWVAPPNAPTDQLPLHIWFPSLQPGEYAVRWITQMPEFSPGKLDTVDSVASDWTTFFVTSAPRSQREEWLRGMLAKVPSAPGMLAGEFIPDLAAAAPDDRALRAIANLLYSNNQVVSRLAASALQIFPEDQVNKLLMELIHTHGPSDTLAYMVSAEPLRRYRASMVTDCIQSLDSSNTNQIAAAIKTLRFFLHLPPNADDPPSASMAVVADAAVLRAAPRIIAAGHEESERELAEYLGTLKQPEAHELLWQIASSGGSAAEQARISLAWNPIPDDLRRLAALLIQPGDPDPTGRDLSSIPYSLMRGYGATAIPWLDKALADSPYVWVRTASARELVHNNDPAALRFFLDAIMNRRFYKDEMTRFLKDAFPSDLKQDADDTAVVKFLTDRLSPK